MRAAPSDPGRIVYVANVRIPSEKAHVLQIFKTCEGLRRLGADVRLVHPRRRRTKTMESVEDAFAYYSVRHPFGLAEVRVPDLVGSPLSRLAPTGIFSLQSLWLVLAALRKEGDAAGGLYYTRDFVAATVLAARRTPFLFEVHTAPAAGSMKGWMRYVGRRAAGIVSITKGLADEWAAAGLADEAVLVAPDAVDEAWLEPGPEREAARRALALPPGRAVAVYAGHLYPWKGIGTAVAAARALPDVLFVFVGGMAEDVRTWRRRASSAGLENVRFDGHVPPARVRDYLAAADVLLLPNSGRSRLSARHTSPLKAFEYMAAARPIVASDLPSLREIFVDGENALLVPPDDAAALAGAVRRLVSDSELAGRLAGTARRSVEGRTWSARAEAILAFLRERVPLRATAAEAAVGAPR